MIPRENMIDPMSQLKRLRALDGGQGQREGEQPSDQQIVAGLVAGEEWAAETLYDRLHPVVDRVLRRVLQSNADHEDHVQVVFERTIRTLVERKFAGACSLSTWASAIASNVAVDALRARIRERALVWEDRARGSEHAVSVPSGNLERQLEARAELEELHAILGSMDAAQAETVLLHDVHGHELTEIALIMGVSVAAAQSRLVRGRKELLRRARIRLGRSS
ncbi:MAG TPA: RNA polymerase sigma factor [Polyangiaceae bacterium]|nr:RNA polymerase sigma factor [Polyangiaceae bacterium]